MTSIVVREIETCVDEKGSPSVSSAIKIITPPIREVIYPKILPKKEDNGEVAITRNVESIINGTSGSTMRLAISP